MIKNIVFDIGNVLAAFRWKEYIAELGYEGEMADRLARATTLNKMWYEVDRNVMPVNDIIEGCIASDPEIEPQIRHFFADRRRLVMEYDYSRGWLEELKNRGYRIYLLSNYSQDHFQYISRHFSFFGLEDGQMVSFRVKLLKPDRRIYEALFEKYGLKPEECVFLDDSPRNIQGAIDAGMKGIVFENYEQGRRELEEILGKEM
ncbi:MAG: HAD family phosphatase [Lachnospiraceae bacterium]|nr:HAD family phosphatase [Lachnospiraceae bacterium]